MELSEINNLTIAVENMTGTYKMGPVTINIENRNSKTIKLAGELDFLPGVNFPGDIPRGARGMVTVPRALVGSFEARSGSLVIEAFGKSFQVAVNDLDLQRSTWDGTALSVLAGKQVSIRDGKSHTLVIFSR